FVIRLCILPTPISTPFVRSCEGRPHMAPLRVLCLATLAARASASGPALSLLGFAFDPEDDDGTAPRDAPEWCKSGDELTAEQRKEKAVTEGKLAWATKERN
ncbi:unnamed protein product, partial [Prorocentrum cordatum]